MYVLDFIVEVGNFIIELLHSIFTVTTFLVVFFELFEHLLDTVFHVTFDYVEGFFVLCMVQAKMLSS